MARMDPVAVCLAHLLPHLSEGNKADLFRPLTFVLVRFSENSEVRSRKAEFPL